MAAEPVNEPIQLRPDQQPFHEGEMTLLEHLRELRTRVLICAVAVVLGMLLCVVFWETIVGWLIAPARAEIPDFRLTVFSPTETIALMFKIGMYGGLMLASPVVLYEILAFIVPGLTPRERKLVLPGIIGVVGFLIAGMAFAYWIILPASLGFLLNFGGDNFDQKIGVKQYFDFAIRIIFWVGVSFELPMVLTLLAKLRVVRAKQLLGFWRYAIVIIFIVAAIVTPTPDPLTQSLVAGPLLGLYVLGIGLAWVVQPKRPKPEAAP
ncbi:MAG: twin-arginine translocase subunit TatC [Dehalococcoidia bacterium]|jgi:sec-independent protein translocase protein TatC|uniref:twin-arginine translocase subunit TatC n=1 Tax=Candidatus Amarobacter glycogenicus TaxID=3140699 RepID=UPI001D9566B2|nr:twin-arginine translocase subunit TatC [Dehalococcoidia bacterium]MBK7125853.1 twin-arginine translocase subunit TatC [Dehalococcoidia bacterium]MBK7328494.1 twin-arginine translocase subunit TatC [Dehalococcoidia bacterium]MBK7724137.1 twin-arginine translocase subunit TatC [Dehalococcoidia bacterium]MBK8559430.1 twin-arginine translocase subunit TatC [Dehalococcoidia bacterium]